MFFWVTLCVAKINDILINYLCFTGFLSWSASITCFPAHLTQQALPNSNHRRIRQSPASSLFALSVALAKRLSKEPWGCWHKRVLPLSQLAHLKYVLPTNLPMCDRASRSAVALKLLLASFNSKNLPQLNEPQSKASHVANHIKPHPEGWKMHGDLIWDGESQDGGKSWDKMSVVLVNEWVFSGWIYLFFWQFPALADRHWKKTAKNEQTGMMREQEEGMQGKEF